MTTTRGQIYFNGPIITMDERDHMASAVGVREGRIVCVGGRREVHAIMGADSEKIDLGGNTMTPGFIDPHGHFPDSGIAKLFRVDLCSPPLGECASLSDVFERIATHVSATPKGEWVMGVLFDHTAIAEGRFPTRRELDAISTDHPIWIVHISGHAGAANSMALTSHHIDESAKDRCGGRFHRDHEGKLNGLLEGMAAMGAMGDTGFLVDETRFKAGFEEATREYYAHGVTLAQNAWATETLLRYFNEVAPEADPGMDVMVLPAGELEPGLSRGELGIQWSKGRRVKIGPRKLFADGAFQMQTAYLSKPYAQPANGDPNHCGAPGMAPAELARRVRQLHDAGFQIHIHANGDAGADITLDAIKQAQQTNPREDHRHTIIHGQTLRDDQLDRMAELGVTVSFFSAHIYYWGDKHRDVYLGPERAERISPARSAIERDIRFTIHNDATVTPTRPLHLMSCAVRRLTASGHVLGSAQRITPAEALRAHTIDAAWQVFLEHERGSIETGKRADFAILSDNPLKENVDLSAIEVVQTVADGKSVYRSGEADHP